MLKTLISVMLLGYVVQAAVMKASANKLCTDSEGNKHAHGEEWKEGKCVQCHCYDGFSACMSPMCMGPPFDGKQCKVRPETENDCCKRYICEEALSLCPAGSTVAPSCPISLCGNTACEGHPDAECRISRCNGCSAKFYKHNELVECDGGPVEIKPECPKGPVIYCFVAPCQFGRCDPHPNSVCHVNYCEHCEAVYYDSNNKELDCRPLKGK